MRALLLVLSLTSLAACGWTPPGGGQDAGGGSDGGGSDGGAGGSGGNNGDAGFGPPITAANETWTFVAFPEARCGNGTSTGLAVNLTSRSSDVVIYLQGGGACWEPGNCYVIPTTTHFTDTMDEAAVLAEARQNNFLFDRTRADNPFRDASFVYVPYCTGDLHGGTRQHTYSALGQTRFGHHVGALNVAAFLSRLVPTFSQARRVWLTGASAGGFGAVINWWRVQQAFGATRVDVLDDSGLLVDPADARYATMRDNWGLQFPPGCAACDAGFSGFLGATAGVSGPAQLALLAYQQDNVVALYFGLTGAQLEQRVNALRPAMAANQKSYQVSGTAHVLLGQNPLPRADGGLLLTDWLARFAARDGGWDHQGP